MCILVVLYILGNMDLEKKSLRDRVLDTQGVVWKGDNRILMGMSLSPMVSSSCGEGCY